MIKFVYAAIVASAITLGAAPLALADPIAPVTSTGHAGYVVNSGQEFIYGYGSPSPNANQEYTLNAGQHVLILNSQRGADGQIWYYVLPSNGLKAWIPESQVRWR